MAHVQKIRVQHIRTHRDRTISLSPTVTVITGPNGSGKTSLIEALYIAMQGSSFRGTDTDNLSQGIPWYRIDVWCSDGTMRVVKFDSERIAGRKQFIVDGKTLYRLSPLYKRPVVLFEPDDLRLLHGSPPRRRQFIDQFISQIDPKYAPILRRYDRALKQRNALLKRPDSNNDDLFAWNISLSEYGAYIIDKRRYFISQLNSQLNGTYQQIARSKDVVLVRYSESSSNTQQKLLADLHSHTGKDMVLGFTSVGPHRHDILFDFNKTSALQVASRGEVRSIVLALKLIEVTIIEQLTNEKPLILLDDVFSELDEHRQSRLLINDTHQVVVTSTSYRRKLPIGAKKIELG